MKVFFDYPMLLILGVLAVPAFIFGIRRLFVFDTTRRSTALALRTALILLLAVLIASPSWRQTHDDLTVIGVVDLSGSVRRFAPRIEGQDGPATFVTRARRWLEEAVATRNDDDRFGLVVFDGEATAISTPARSSDIDPDFDIVQTPGTNIADAIKLALAMFPADTGRRIVLFTDGNETSGNSLDAARQAAGLLPIDVVPIEYRVRSDAQVARVEVPASAEPGQTINVRIRTESTGTISGELVLRSEGRPVDLNGREPGRGRRVVLSPGSGVHLANVILRDRPVNRFEAIFVPDDPSQDALPDNNQAGAFTSTPGRGRTLILNGPQATADLLAGVIGKDDRPTETLPAGEMPTDLLSLQNFDLIVMNDVASTDVTPSQHALLRRYVEDLGGGLVVVGGGRSFGVGGWNGTEFEGLLPIELDPPKSLRLPQAALVLVIDQSGSMNRPVAGARATQQEVANEAAGAAIESLRSESLVGVIAFNTSARTVVPLQVNEDPPALAARVRTIRADGGTNLAPALASAHEMLRNAKADRKRVVCLTDGQSSKGRLEERVAAMADEGIRVSTIAVGDDADHATLRRLADLGGGTFYPVYNANALPRVLVDSVQVVNKPLIKEIPFTPVVERTGASLTAEMTNAPRLGGIVITAARTDPRAVVELTHPDGEPLLAHWQVGLGRVAAFTSDAGGPWSRAWNDWPGGERFWLQLARTTARPAVAHEAELTPRIENGVLHLRLDAADDEGFIDLLQVEGTVYRPDGREQSVRLQQTGPGQYETSVPAVDSGNYIVALRPRRGDRQLAPVIGGANQPRGPEFRSYESNRALLEAIASATGGRELALDTPSLLELFDRTDMLPQISLRPAWPVLLWVTLGLYLLDVANRRIAWSAAGIADAVARAMEFIRPGRRGHAAVATLRTLREVDEVTGRRIANRSAKTVAPRQGPVEVSGDRAVRPEPPEPSSPSRVSAALNILRRGTPEDDRTAEPPAEAERPETAEPRDESRRSLFEAKRRARKRHGS